MISRDVPERLLVIIVVCNAGIVRTKYFGDYDDNDWHTLINVHLHGTYSIVRAAWPHFKGLHFVLLTMKFALKTMNFVLKTMNSVLKTMDFALKTMNFVSK